MVKMSYSTYATSAGPMIHREFEVRNKEVKVNAACHCGVEPTTGGHQDSGPRSFLSSL